MTPTLLPNAERGFALAAVVVCVGLAVVAGTTSAGPGPSDGSEFEPAVPDEYAFAEPQRDGVATVGGERYDTIDRALDAATPGETVRLDGRFDGPVTVETPNVTLSGAGPDRTLIEGDGEGDVLTIAAANVTVESVWIHNGGYATEDNDAGVWIDADGATMRDSRISEMTFGIWLDSVDGATVANTTIVGRDRVTPLSNRGNGIQVFETTDTRLVGNRITDARDGIYYSWASEVLARNNTMWDLRYGVHYMYSDDCRLVGNVAVDSDAGYALMVSKRLTIRDNVAVNNTGGSGHGILVKSIDDTAILNNTLVGNGNGLFVYNSLDNVLAGNRVQDNEVGVHLAAGSVRERVHHNSFVGNDQPVKAVVGEQVAWNDTVGNYWGGANTIDLDDDGVSEVRYRPAGRVERLTARHPTAAVFTGSPAFDAIRRAENTVPLVESPGVVDYRPLTDPPGNWSEYHE